MKVKQKAKRVVSGLLTAVTLLSTVLSPINSYAAELPKEKKLPLLEEVQSLLDEDEIVLAKDHQVEVGTSFDVKTDFTGLEIKDAEKVKITFEEAKNEQGEDFTTSHADTYKTVYQVETVNQEHPNYQISRNVVVKEIEKESESPSADAEQSETKETEEDEEDSEKPSEIPTETDVSEENAAFDALIEETMDQETYDEVSGLELRDVMEQAVEQGVDFNGMEPGEITTIKAMARTAGVGSQQVTIEKGPIYRYLLKGAGFSAYLKSSLEKKEDGSYDFSHAEPVILTADGKTEMFTDEKGYACSIPLPYGTYIVRETTTPHNYKPVEDFEITIRENNPDKPQVWKVLLDKEFSAKLKIIKKDDETKKPVLVAGTEFKIYDLDHKKYVEQVTTYPTVTVHKSFFTDSQGYLILPKNLEIGHYRIEEVTAPDGYVVNKNYVEITVDSDTAYEVDGVSGDVIIEVSYEDQPVKGNLIVYKKGEMLSGFENDFIYKEQYLSGAEFEVRAAEDICTPDHQKDADGNRIVLYAKDTLVTTITTGEGGKAVAKDLPLGRYYVVETKAPEGFVLNPEPVKVALTYQDQDTPIVEAEAIVGNDRQKVSISVEKQDAENGRVLSGAVFGIYNKKNIQANGKVLVKADTLLQEMTSDENGMATCTLDLPFGEYYVKELKAPEGFVSSDEVLEFVAEYQGQETKIVSLQAVKKNEPTTAEFTKSDLTTGVELEGARLKVMDKDGNVIDEWTSEKDKPHVIKRLVVGETYTLHEEFAPYGYLKATDVTFKVKDTAEAQKVEMKDEVPKGLLIINKKGEFLEKITLLDNVKGTVEHFFEYITGNLSEVTFEVYAAEDIKAADGVSADHYKKDELVGTITTDEKGIAKMEDLPVGKYCVKEVKTAHGFVLDGEPRFVDLTYRDQDTPVVTFDEEWQNNRQKIKVTVLKKEKDTERMLEGAIFGLFTKEDIKGRDGKVLMEAGTLIEQKTTDENGQILFKADLPVDGTYIVKEIYAPDGFVTSNEEKEFTFEYGKPEEAEVSYEFVFENEPTKVELTKTDLTTGKELPGAHLKVTDEDGNVIDEWVSTEKAHVIKGLTVGKSYMMTETKPADGYVTAESITFTVENTAEIQKQEMKDDVTKVLISKQDIAGKELPGAKLTILDEDGKVVESWTSTEEAHYIEMLPIGKYMLREETAPEGYLVAKDVEFEVKDTAEVQKVVMVDEEKPKESTPEGGKPSKDAPKTGDNTNLLLWLIVLGMSFSGVVVLGRKIKKK